MAEGKSLLGNESNEVKEYGPLYHDKAHSPKQRYLQIGFVVLVVIAVGITLILSIYRGSSQESGGLYFLLGLSLLGFVLIEVFMIYFVRNDHLPSDKLWFLYFVGGCVIVESIFTDVLLMD